MVQLQLINSVIEWERRLEFVEERRRNHRSEPYVNYLAPVQPQRSEWKSLFARIILRRKDRKERRSPVNFVKALSAWTYLN